MDTVARQPERLHRNGNGPHNGDGHYHRSDPKPEGNVTQSGPADVTQGIQDIQRYRGIQGIQRDTAPRGQAASGALNSENASEEESPEDRDARERNDKRYRSERFKERLARPFDEFICNAFNYAWESAIAHGWDADENTEWKSPLFWFTWMLRGHKAMEPMLQNAKKALKEIEPYLMRWSKTVRQKGQLPRTGVFTGDPWQEWFGIDKADARAQFMDVWKSMRFTPGQDPLTQATDANRRLRLLVNQTCAEQRPVDEDHKSESDYEFFIGVAGHLQIIMGDRQILLPCRAVGDSMKVSAMTISRYRKWAAKDGFLVVTKEHRFRSKGTGDATEFRFNVGRWPALKEKAQRGSQASFATYAEA